MAAASHEGGHDKNAYFTMKIYLFMFYNMRVTCNKYLCTDYIVASIRTLL